MIILREKQSLVKHLQRLRCHPSSMTIGFVPTMGYLHDGHVSLIRAAAAETDCVVVSLFVNPTQFGPNEDFSRYPRDENRDLQLCEVHGADIVFIPSVEEMYASGSATEVMVSGLTDGLCGRFRPGHFKGVTTIVAKLFNLVQPRKAYFGQKDAQQLLVISKMVSDLDYSVQIRICPTVREPDGLAMSSRNVRLSANARKLAPLIFQALQSAAKLAAQGENSVTLILEAALAILDSVPELKVEYLECRDRELLGPLQNLDRPALLATAVFLDGVRLIDNVFIDPAEKPDDTSN